MRVKKHSLLRQQLFPLIALRIGLDHLVALFDEVFEVFGKIDAVHHPAETAVWRLKLNEIDHDRAIIAGLEMMFMLQTLKIAFYLFIHKNLKLLHLRDLRAKNAVLEKMSRPPGNGLILLDQPEPGAGNRLFAVFRHGMFMQINTPCKIEYPFRRCGNKGGQVDGRHTLADYNHPVKPGKTFLAKISPLNADYTNGILQTFARSSLSRTLM